jgi:NitT/TauT family transport system permease protein
MVTIRYRHVPVAVTCLVLIPMIAEAANEGCRRIEPELIDVYRLNGGFSLRVLVQVYLPLMAGYLRQAYVNAVGMGLRLTVSTEYLVQTTDSLGKAVNTSSYFNEYQDIYAYALIMVLMILLLSEMPTRLARRLSEARETRRGTLN